MPGDMFMERRIRSMMRWNALAMVLRANQSAGDLGGHVSTFASAATLYDVGFNHFFRGETATRRATSFISRATARRGSMRGRFSRGA